MMLKLIVLCVSVQILLVSGNSYTLIPLQSCPQNCNGRQNCNQNYQNPINIPIIQNPIQNVPAKIYQQPNNNQLYPQGYTAQNQITPIQNQVMDPLNQLNQIYMNKILSNPTLQTILDPNTLYSQLGIEMPRQVNNVPNTTPHSHGTPIINNYYILPPELFENVIVKENRGPNAQKRDREANKRPNHGGGVRKGGNSAEHISPEHRRRNQNSQNPETSSRRPNQRRPNGKMEQRYSKEDAGRHDRRRRPDERQRISEHERDRKVPAAQNPHNRRRQQQGERQDSTQRDNARKKLNKKESPKSDGIVNKKKQPGSSEKFTSSEKAVENSRKMNRKAKDDAIIRDFHEKFPGIPEEIVRKLLSYLRKQLRKQQTENRPLTYPNFPFPLKYDQLFPQLDFYNNHRRTNRRNPDRKSKPKTTSKPVETTTNTESLTIPTTTETVKVKKPPTKVRELEIPTKNLEKIVIDLTTVLPTTSGSEEPETTTVSHPELGNEDKILDISNRIYPDYYPQFMNDHQYYESEEVYNVRNLRDDRYYYTTDRSYESKPSMHEYNMRKLKKMHRKLEDSFEDVLPKPEFESKHDSESVEFRTPPLLDAPDFRTKQIIKHKPDNFDKHLSYKSSNYSDAKNPPNSKIHKNRKPKTENIETVYAHSKVVKYGKTNEESEENATPVVTYYLPDNMQYEEDGKTIVIAKSIPADHFW